MADTDDAYRVAAELLPYRTNRHIDPYVDERRHAVAARLRDIYKWRDAYMATSIARGNEITAQKERIAALEGERDAALDKAKLHFEANVRLGNRVAELEKKVRDLA